MLAQRTLDRLAAQKDPGDYVVLMQRLEDLRDRFRGTPAGDRAAEEIKRLEKDPEVVRELDASRALEALRRRFDPERPQHRRVLIPRLRSLAEKYEGTKAAKEAREWLSRLRG